MDLLQLEHFLAVVEERTFTRAAERVCRTQPAVSQSIKKLEEEVGAPLFARDVPEVPLTEAGRVLADYARRTVHLRDEALRQVTELSRSRPGTLAIAAHHHFTPLAHGVHHQRGDRHQLPGSPGAVDRDRGDSAGDPAQQHGLLPAADRVSRRLRRDVRRRRRAHRPPRDAPRLPGHHGRVVARVRGPRPGHGLPLARAQPVSARRRRGRRLPRRHQGGRGVVPRPRAFDGHGHHQRRHGHRRRRRAAAHRDDRARRQLALGVLHLRRRRPRVDRVVVGVLSPAGGASRPLGGRAGHHRRRGRRRRPARSRRRSRGSASSGSVRSGGSSWRSS